MFKFKKVALVASIFTAAALSVAALASCGEKGEPGEKGDKGDDGAAGVGISNIVSAPNADGTKTVVTITLSDGTTKTVEIANGAAGADGADGANGADGLTPTIGENGNWWIGGTDTGVKAAGADGAQGEKGDKGDKGDTGAAGADGVGIADIATEEVADGTKITITLTNGTTTSFVVKNGVDGVDGENGADGADGLTPYVGENGNWWIGEVDTGVYAGYKTHEHQIKDAAGNSLLLGYFDTTNNNLIADVAAIDPGQEVYALYVCQDPLCDNTTFIVRTHKENYGEWKIKGDATTLLDAEYLCKNCTYTQGNAVINCTEHEEKTLALPKAVDETWTTVTSGVALEDNQVAYAKEVDGYTWLAIKDNVSSCEAPSTITFALYNGDALTGGVFTATTKAQYATSADRMANIEYTVEIGQIAHFYDVTDGYFVFAGQLKERNLTVNALTKDNAAAIQAMAAEDVIVEAYREGYIEADWNTAYYIVLCDTCNKPHVEEATVTFGEATKKDCTQVSYQLGYASYTYTTLGEEKAIEATNAKLFAVVLEDPDQIREEHTYYIYQEAKVVDSNYTIPGKIIGEIKYEVAETVTIDGQTYQKGAVITLAANEAQDLPEDVIKKLLFVDYIVEADDFAAGFTYTYWIKDEDFKTYAKTCPYCEEGSTNFKYEATDLVYDGHYHDGANIVYYIGDATPDTMYGYTIEDKVDLMTVTAHLANQDEANGYYLTLENGTVIYDTNALANLTGDAAAAKVKVLCGEDVVVATSAYTAEIVEKCYTETATLKVTVGTGENALTFEYIVEKIGAGHKWVLDNEKTVASTTEVKEVAAKEEVGVGIGYAVYTCSVCGETEYRVLPSNNPGVVDTVAGNYDEYKAIVADKDYATFAIAADCTRESTEYFKTNTAYAVYEIEDGKFVYVTDKNNFDFGAEQVVGEYLTHKDAKKDHVWADEWTVAPVGSSYQYIKYCVNGCGKYIVK